VILTTYDHDRLVLEAIRAGAKGYLLKDDPADEMIRAIHLAHRGESLLQPAVAAKLLAALQGAPTTAGPVPMPSDSWSPSPAWEREDPSRPALADPSWERGHPAHPRLVSAPVVGGETLTERERQVLQLAAAGASNLQIAHRLHLAEGTVKNHISLIMDKLGASNRTQAATIARQRRLIE
jgi:DNA-binding NarL/FixJ family response regulator